MFFIIRLDVRKSCIQFWVNYNLFILDLPKISLKKLKYNLRARDTRL